MAKGVRPLGRVLRMKRAGPRPQRVAGRAVALIPVVIFAFPTPARPRIPKSPTAVKPQHLFRVRGVSPVGSPRSTNVSPGGGAERIEHSGHRPRLLVLTARTIAAILAPARIENASATTQSPTCWYTVSTDPSGTLTTITPR